MSCGWGPTPDERSLPTGRRAAERIPGVAGDHAELRRTGSQLTLNVSTGLRRAFMDLDAVHAERPFEESSNSTAFELTGLNFSQVVCQGEQPKAGIAQLSQRSSIGSHRNNCWKCGSTSA